MVGAFAATANAAAPSVGASDAKVTGPPIPYVRHDGGTDASIEACNDTEDPLAFGAFTQNNEPFSVVDPSNHDLIVSGWNDYCGDWMGLGFSTDGGETWTDSLVPGYPADTSTEGMASPEFGRTNEASDPSPRSARTGRCSTSGSWRSTASPGRRRTRTWPSLGSRLGARRPGLHDLSARLRRHDAGRQGPAAANFKGDLQRQEHDRDRSGTRGVRSRATSTSAGRSSPANGTPTIRFRASSDGGRTFAPPVNLTEAEPDRDATSPSRPTATCT
jgi:hypothetical protein